MSSKGVGVFLVGINGAIGTTVTCGVFAILRGIVDRFGMVTDLEPFSSMPLIGLEAMNFYGWDLRAEPHIDRVKRQDHLSSELIEGIAEDLRRVQVFPAPYVAVSQHVASMIEHHASPLTSMSRMEAVVRLRSHIVQARNTDKFERAVVVNVASTEILPRFAEAHSTLEAFEAGLLADDPSITAAMLYAYAAIAEGVPFINFTPSTAAEIPALLEFALRRNVPLAGKDGKTGQTLYKTVLASMFRWRNLKVRGWFSTNILGNEDGYVLSDKDHAEGKLTTKKESLGAALNQTGFFHQVKIDYYPPRGDAKEAWDVIDFTGWLGSKMSMRINWLGQDSCLAAPLIVDLIRFVTYAHERGQVGPLVQLAAFFKAPMGCDEHGFAEQMQILLAHCRDSLIPPE
jgi:myo-inositol-1-phosphate synthase